MQSAAYDFRTWLIRMATIRVKNQVVYQRQSDLCWEDVHGQGCVRSRKGGGFPDNPEVWQCQLLQSTLLSCESH